VSYPQAEQNCLLWPGTELAHGAQNPYPKHFKTEPTKAQKVQQALSRSIQDRVETRRGFLESSEAVIDQGETQYVGNGEGCVSGDDVIERNAEKSDVLSFFRWNVLACDENP